MNKINQLFAERPQEKKFLSLYFCAGCPTLYQPLTMKISLCGKYHGWEKAYQGTNIGVFCIKCKFLSNFSTKHAKKVAKCLQIEIKIVNLQP